MQSLLDLENGLFDQGYVRCVQDGELQVEVGDIVMLQEPLRDSTTTALWMSAEKRGGYTYSYLDTAQWLILNTERVDTDMGPRVSVVLVPKSSENYYGPLHRLTVMKIFMALDPPHNRSTDVYYVRKVGHVEPSKIRGELRELK